MVGWLVDGRLVVGWYCRWSVDYESMKGEHNDQS